MAQRILVVDDEDKIRALIKKYAEFEGHKVREADNGMKAVELFRKEKFDIIIMDIMMPELDGFSAVKEIRKTSDVPVIMLSARGEEYDKIHGFMLLQLWSHTNHNYKQILLLNSKNRVYFTFNIHWLINL